YGDGETPPARVVKTLRTGRVRGSRLSMVNSLFPCLLTEEAGDIQIITVVTATVIPAIITTVIAAIVTAVIPALVAAELAFITAGEQATGTAVVDAVACACGTGLVRIGLTGTTEDGFVARCRGGGLAGRGWCRGAGLAGRGSRIGGATLLGGVCTGGIETGGDDGDPDLVAQVVVDDGTEDEVDVLV